MPGFCTSVIPVLVGFFSPYVSLELPLLQVVAADSFHSAPLRRAHLHLPYTGGSRRPLVATAQVFSGPSQSSSLRLITFFFSKNQHMHQWMVTCLPLFFAKEKPQTSGFFAFNYILSVERMHTHTSFPYMRTYLLLVLGNDHRGKHAHEFIQQPFSVLFVTLQNNSQPATGKKQDQGLISTGCLYLPEKSFKNLHRGLF